MKAVELKTNPAPTCKLCSAEGALLFRDLKDLLGTTKGAWNIRQCPDCSLLWLDPTPAKEDIHRAYAEYPTHGDDITHGSIKERIRSGYLAVRYGYLSGETSALDKMLGGILWMLPHKRVASDFWFKPLMDRPKGRLLDVGCGGGGLVKMMSGWGWQAEGIDPDEQAVKNARSKGIRANHGNFIEYNYPESSFDVILSSHVFEHVYEPVEFLKKCWRILRPGGMILIATPNADSLQRRLFRGSWLALDPPRHLYLFNPRSMNLCASIAGISNYEITTTCRGARFHSTASMHILKSGAYHWKDRPNLYNRLAGELIELLEVLWLFLSRGRGVELLFSASKPLR